MSSLTSSEERSDVGGDNSQCRSEVFGSPFHVKRHLMMNSRGSTRSQNAFGFRCARVTWGRSLPQSSSPNELAACCAEERTTSSLVNSGLHPPKAEVTPHCSRHGLLQQCPGTIRRWTQQRIPASSILWRTTILWTGILGLRCVGRYGSGRLRIKFSFGKYEHAVKDADDRRKVVGSVWNRWFRRRTRTDGG